VVEGGKNALIKLAGFSADGNVHWDYSPCLRRAPPQARCPHHAAYSDDTL